MMRLWRGRSVRCNSGEGIDRQRNEDATLTVTRLSRPQLPYQDGLEERELRALELFLQPLPVAGRLALGQGFHRSGPGRGCFEHLRFFRIQADSPRFETASDGPRNLSTRPGPLANDI